MNPSSTVEIEQKWGNDNHNYDKSDRFNYISAVFYFALDLSSKLVYKEEFFRSKVEHRRIRSYLRCANKL